MTTPFEQECELLERLLADGTISQSEYNAQLREAELEDAAARQENAERAYHDALNNWW
jgi:hypothetical protein